MIGCHIKVPKMFVMLIVVGKKIYLLVYQCSHQLCIEDSIELNQEKLVSKCLFYSTVHMKDILIFVNSFKGYQKLVVHFFLVYCLV